MFELYKDFPSGVTLLRTREAAQGTPVRMVPSLASYLLTSIDMLWWAHQEGQAGYVLWDEGHSTPLYYDADKAAQNPNMWEWFFEQPFTPNRPQDAWYFVSPYVHSLARKHGGPPKEFVRQVVRFGSEVKARAEQLMAEYGLVAGQFVAVSHRGTDRIYEWPIAPIDSYYSILDSFKDERMLVLPEEEKVLKALQSRYPNSIHIPHFFCAKDGQTQMVDWANPKSKYEKGLDAMAMLYIFSKAKVLLRSAANLSLIACRLMGGECWYFAPGREPVLETSESVLGVAAS